MSIQIKSVERILAGVGGGGQPLIETDAELRTITGEKPRDLAGRYMEYVRYYFSDISNQTACIKNGIIYEAEINVHPLFQIFKDAISTHNPDKLYYFNANHLGSGSLITDKYGQTYQTLIYAPHGEVLLNKFYGDYDEPYKFNGKELDSETGFYNFNARQQDPIKDIWTSTDPMWYKYPNKSPYAVNLNNSVKFVDPNGKEPILPYVGTAGMFRILLNNGTRGVGYYTGQQAANYLRSLGSTKWSWKQMRPLPTQTGYFNMKAGRYIYTENGGWLDMSHFMFYAGKAYDYKLQKQAAQSMVNSNAFGFMSPEAQAYWYKQAGMSPVGEAIQDGYRQEMSDRLVAPYSAYSYEDLPSDRFGADFGANYFDPNSKLSFGEQLEDYLNNVLKATNPQNAPNYNNLPATESTDKPSRTNKTTNPVYTKENP